MASQVLASTRHASKFTVIDASSSPLRMPATNVLLPGVRAADGFRAKQVDPAFVEFENDSHLAVNCIGLGGIRVPGITNLLPSSDSINTDIGTGSHWSEVNLDGGLLVVPGDTSFPGPLGGFAGSWYMEPDSAASGHRLQCIVAIPFDVTPLQLTISCYFNDDVRDDFELRLSDTGSLYAESRFNASGLADGSIDSETSAGACTHDGSTITNLNDGWHRLTMTATFTGAIGAQLDAWFSLMDGASGSFLGAPPGDGAFFAHPMVELGPTASPVGVDSANLQSAASWRVLFATTQAKLSDGTAEYDSGLLPVMMSVGDFRINRDFQHSIHLPDAPQTYPFSRIEIYGETESEIDIGSIFFDDAIIAPVVRINNVNVLAEAVFDKTSIAESGAVWTVNESRFGTVSYSLLITTEVQRDRYYELSRTVGSSGEVYIGLNPGGTYDQYKSIFGIASFGPLRKIGTYWVGSVTLVETR